MNIYIYFRLFTFMLQSLHPSILNNVNVVIQPCYDEKINLMYTYCFVVFMDTFLLRLNDQMH
jgi:hypothetical protein